MSDYFIGQLVFYMLGGLITIATITAIIILLIAIKKDKPTSCQYVAYLPSKNIKKRCIYIIRNYYQGTELKFIYKKGKWIEYEEKI